LKKAEDKLKSDLVETSLAQQATLQTLNELTARQLRLQRQQETLKDRASEMLRRDVDSLDELDEIERLEAAARDEATQNAHAAPVPDPYGFLANEDYLDPERLASLAAFVAGSADPGSGGETPQVSQNS
jgi:hypothetical protein